ncbi:hypothetical protein [Cohnella silvisoli]|uniref:Uncharacterized protein n=1 Tax=Cohnella silvisoli TaxID=2873699 RepID=A0ABV1KYR9_9BACL|nr:hypothetical protein [Cohnella silvisoli]MCD9024387.1 hypothetical protein [Cohnella silvisoli]
MEKYINKVEIVGFLRIQRNLAISLNQNKMSMAYEYVLNKVKQGEFTEIYSEEPSYTGDCLEQLVKKLTLLCAEDELFLNQLQHIEMKNAFRSPEMQYESWNDLARLVKTMPIDRLALLLSEQSQAVSFSEGERAEIRRALVKNRNNINEFIVSNKTSDADKTEAVAWLVDNTNAYAKLWPDSVY